MSKLRTDMDIGENLRALRKSKNLTQDMLVAQLHTKFDIVLSRNTYARYETSELNIPISVLVALHKLYKCSYDDFFSGLD